MMKMDDHYKSNATESKPDRQSAQSFAGNQPVTALTINNIKLHLHSS
jgi:hypothetical protein